MTEERYFQWMRIWRWFATTADTPQLGSLYQLLDILWQDERKQATQQELSGYAAAWWLEDLNFKNDPDYQAYMRERELGGSK